MTATTPTQRLEHLPIDALQPGEYQNRDLFEAERIADLAESIRQMGIRVPLIVRPLTEEGRYQIVAGERRWRAARTAGLLDVPCLIETDMTPQAHATVTLIENMQREELTPIEEARGYATLRDVHNLSPTEIATRVGKGLFAVTSALSLLELPASVQELIHTGRDLAVDGQPPRRYTLTRTQGLALVKHLPKFGMAVVAALAEVAFEQGTSGAAIASDVSRLLTVVANTQVDKDNIPKEDAIAFALPYGGGPFWATACSRCPFGALVGDVKVSYGNKICLKPSHYRELILRRRQEDEDRNQQRIEEVKAKAVEKGVAPDVPLVASLGEVKRIGRGYESPALACTADCPCRKTAVDGGGELVTVCTDPKRFVALKVKETKSANKDRRADAKERTTALVAQMDAAAKTELGYTERELRLICLAALDSITSGTSKITEAGRHIAPHLDDPALFGAKDTGQFSTHYLARISPPRLAAIPTGPLIRFAAESLARRDLVQYHETGGLGRYADAYGPPKEEEETPPPAPAPVPPTPEMLAARDELRANIASQPNGELREVLSGLLAEQEAREIAAFTSPERPRETFALADDDAVVAIAPLDPVETDDDGAEFGIDPDVVDALARRSFASAYIAAENLDPDTTITIYLTAAGAGLAFEDDAEFLREQYGADPEEGPDGMVAARVGFASQEDMDGFGQSITGDKFLNLLIVAADPADNLVNLYTVDGPEPPEGGEPAPEPVEQVEMLEEQADVADQLAALDALLAPEETKGAASQDAVPSTLALPGDPALALVSRVVDPKRAESFRRIAGTLLDEIAYKDRPADPGVNMTRKREQELNQRRREAEYMRPVANGLLALADAWERGAVPNALAGIKNRVQIETIINNETLPTWNDDRKRVASAGIETEAHYLFARELLLTLAKSRDAEAEGRERSRKLDALRARVRVQRPASFFPTPPALAKRMAEMAELEPGDVVLEPCAGDGALVEAILANQPKVALTVQEVNPDLRGILALRGVESDGVTPRYEFGPPDGDFMRMLPQDWQFDRIIANLPFERGIDAVMLLHAYDLLGNDGRIVAIVGPSFFRPTSKDGQARLDRIEAIGYTSEPLPQGTFAPDTQTGGTLLVIDKVGE